MNELFMMTVGRVFFTLAASPAVTLLGIVAVFTFCLIFQLTILRRENKVAGKPLAATHFLWTTLFILYLLVVYRLTGIGTLWSIINTGADIPLRAIHPIPFMSFADGMYGFLFFTLNILMTIPLGLFLAALWPSMRSFKMIALTGLLFSLAIEFSQLFTNRGTNVDDLIANTLGAIIGYLIYWAFSEYRRKKASANKNDKQQLHQRCQQLKKQAEQQSKILRYEGITYLILTFLGMFLLFNSAAAANFDTRLGLTSNMGTITTDTTDPLRQQSDVKGIVLELRAEGILLELIKVEDLGDDSFIAASTDTELFIWLDESTTVDIWRIDESQVAFPVAMDTDVTDIRAGDMADIILPDSVPDNDIAQPDVPAQHITVWRFP